MKKTIKIFLTLLILLLAPGLGLASQAGKVREGNRHYQKGDYAKALESYKKALNQDLNSDIINFNVGTSLYQAGEYDQAREPLQKALLSEQARVQQMASYNLGDVFYQQGLAREEKDLNGAIADLEKSLSSFEKAMALDTEDQDAKHNYEFVKKELERLKKKQKEQQDKNCPLPKKENGSKQDQDNPQSRNQQQEQQQDQSQEQQAQDKQSQDQQKQQDQQPQEQAQQQSSGASQEKDQQGAQQQQQSASENSGQSSMSPQQAQRQLNDYQQTEEPKGFLYLLQQKKQPRTTDKDW